MIISEHQLLESTNFKKYQAKVKDELKNPNMLRLKIITIP